MARHFALTVLLSLVLLHIPNAHARVAGDKPVDSDIWPQRYDNHFRKYSKRYFGPNIDWRWFKAQGIAESNLNPRAKSHVGAKGIMQILPTTYTEIKNKNRFLGDISEPRWNIAAGILYDRMMYKKWTRKLPQKERILFSFGSYNAGFGTIRKAFRRASRKTDTITHWQDIARFTPGQTRHYVRRIYNLMPVHSRPKNPDPG